LRVSARGRQVNAGFGPAAGKFSITQVFIASGPDAGVCFHRMNRPRNRASTAARRWLSPVSLLGCGSFFFSAIASTNLDLARQLNQAFVEVVEKASPAVVVITVETKSRENTSARADSAGDDDFPNDFWREFHRQFQEGAPLERETGQGSGIIVREDGFILTNRHVVEDADTIQVRLKDGRKFTAKLRGVDPQSDLAVIQIDARQLPVARFADSSKTRVGEFAIAIGAPFQLDYSVTFGHVSAKGRQNVVPAYVGGAMLDQDFIQTDANINPGSSGGPLLNLDGEVIGINTVIRGLHTGIGFAIPSNLARPVAEQLIAKGRFTRAWLGVSVHALRDDAELRESLGAGEDGVVVNAILPEGAAARSELRQRDVILAVDGVRVRSPQDLRNEIRGKPIGQPVTLEVSRASGPVKIKVTPAEWVGRPDRVGREPR
jgi:serine protease Do